MIKKLLLIVFLIFTICPCYPQISNLPKNNNLFTGREQEIARINKHFLNDKTAYIVGMSGIGKTQIMKKYLHTYGKKYDIIWWVEGDKSIATQMLELAKKLNVLLVAKKEKPVMINEVDSSQTMADLRERLLKTDLKWILAYDNMKNDIEVTKTIESNNLQDKHVMITSKNSLISNEKIEIGRFSREESIKFLKQLPDTKYKEQDLNSLAELLGDYPLPLAQAYTYI